MNNKKRRLHHGLVKPQQPTIDLRLMAAGQSNQSASRPQQTAPRQPITPGPINHKPFLTSIHRWMPGLRLRPYYRKLGRAQYPFIMMLALAMAYSTTAGQWITFLYALVVLIFKVDSRQPLIIALLFVAAIPLFQLIHLSDVSANAAVYAFELFVVGVVRAMMEVPKNSDV